MFFYILLYYIMPYHTIRCHKYAMPCYTIYTYFWFRGWHLAQSLRAAGRGGSWFLVWVLAPGPKPQSPGPRRELVFNLGVGTWPKAPEPEARAGELALGLPPRPRALRLRARCQTKKNKKTKNQKKESKETKKSSFLVSLDFCFCWLFFLFFCFVCFSVFFGLGARAGELALSLLPRPRSLRYGQYLKNCTLQG